MTRKLTFEIQFLTPAFAGSAEPRQLDPYMPLRPSAVRGALRSWFRAAAGAVLFPATPSQADGERMIDALRSAESAVFGDTERASPFAVLPISGATCQTRVVPDPNDAPGVRYLGYGIFDKLSPGSPILALETDKPLHLVLALRRDRPGLAELLSATVWLWAHVGGFGARSRRGFGSMILVGARSSVGSVEQQPALPPERLVRPADMKALIDDCLGGLDWVVDVFRRHLPDLTLHPLLAAGAEPHPGLRTVDGIRVVSVLPTVTADGMSALEIAGRLFRDYRSTLQRNKLGMPPLPDYFAVKSSLESRMPPRTLDRAAFGLPLSFYFRSLGGRRTTFGPQQGGRVPSPLLFRVQALGPPQEKRRVVVLFNLAQGSSAQILLGCTIGQLGEAWRVPTPDGRIVDEAIHWMIGRAQEASPRLPRGKQ